MANRELTTIAQAAAAGLFPQDEHHDMLDVGTAGEVAEEAERRLLLAGHLPWWPDSRLRPPTKHDPWAAFAATDLLLIRAPISEFGRYYRQSRTIVLRDKLSPEKERETLWHELLHAERDHDSRTLTDEEHDVVTRDAIRLAGAA